MLSARNGIWILLALILLLVGCGQQEGPIPEHEELGNATTYEEEDPVEKTAPTIQEIPDDQVEPSIEPEEFIRRFKQNDYAFIYAYTTEEFQNTISLEELEELSEPFNRNVTEYILEAHMPIGGNYKYTWIDDTRSKSVSVYLDKDHRISGFWIYPITTYPETDHVYTKNEYSLPFEGEWFAYWGGTNEVVNYHYAFEDQRYAYDFVKLIDNYTFEADGKSNVNYYAYGEKVLAPADGIVVGMENEVEENTPGSMDPFYPWGNYIIIEHDHNEYSLLAHLQKGSIPYELGDTVKRGDFLGYCGNSGNSSEPHIHFQIMNHLDLYEAVSINPRFRGYESIIQGDFISGN